MSDEGPGPSGESDGWQRPVSTPAPLPGAPAATGGAPPGGGPPAWSTPPPSGPPAGGGKPWDTGALRPLNLGDVLDGMFRLFVRHWRAYVLALAVVLVPVNLLLTWLQQDLLAGAGIIEVLNDPIAAQEAAAGSASLGAFAQGLGAQVANALLVTPFVTGVATVLAAGGVLRESRDAASALRRAAARYPALVVANALTLLAVLAVVGLLVLPLVLLVATGTSPVASVVVGFVLAIAAAAAAGVVWILLLVVPQVVVVEGVGPLRAIGRSVALVRRRFWPVVGTGLLTWLIVVMISSVVVWPFSLPAMLVGGTTALVLTALGTVLGGIVTAPLLPNAYTLIYYDLRVRTEALDLEAMAAALDDGEGGPA